jgi:CubicO group peptidase (beta-lactamase class C family)
LRIDCAALAVILVCAGPCLAAPAGPAPPAVAETPASEQARRLLQIAASSQDDAAALDAVRQIETSPPLAPDRWPTQRAFLKRLQVHGLERATATEAELTAYDAEMEVWAHVTVKVEADVPHRITGLIATPGPPPADLPPTPRLQPTQLAAAVKAKASALAQADKFSGAVLIAHAGRPVLAEAYGLADRGSGARNTTETQFRFGSMGKMFTAVAVMQLVQAGKLDLAAPVGTYLKDYPNQDIAQHVTVGHLLSHSGGTGDIFGPEFMARRQELRDPKDYVALYGARAPLFPAGSRQAYSNYGFMLLGRIVEAASGLSYDDYIQRHVFAPAGMTATGNAPETMPMPRRSVSYTGAPGQIRSAADTLPWRGTPAGGGYSTVGDMLRFATALTSNRLLDQDHYRLLTTGGVIGPDGRLLRYDFGSQSPNGRRYLGHNGGAPGMNGELRIYPDGDWVVVVLANRDPPVAQTIANFVSDRLP